MKNIFSACVYSHFQFWGMLFCKLPFFFKIDRDVDEMEVVYFFSLFSG